MYMNTPRQKNIDLENYENTLKEGIQTVIIKINDIFNYIQENHTDKEINLHEEYHKLRDINYHMSIILKFVKENYILESEYYDFMEMQSLINQSLENKNKEEIKIASKIFNEFKKITELKFDLLYEDIINNPNKDIKTGQIFNNISENKKKEFEKEYKKFSHFFFKCEMEYHTLEGKTKHESAKKYLTLFDREYLK